MSRYLLALLCLSCGTAQPGDEPAQGLQERSGNRLRRQAWTASDGTVSYTVGYYDTKTKKSCAFRPLRGSWYCLPDDDLTPADASRYVSARIETED